MPATCLRKIVFSSSILALWMALGTARPIYAANDPVPGEQLPGRWKDAKGVIVTIAMDEKGALTLTRNGVEWDLLIPYSPGKSLYFKHKPTPEEMPDDIPAEIKQKAFDAGLEWRLRFTKIETGYRALGHTCRLFLEGNFLPGEVNWKKVVNKDTGEETNIFNFAKVGGAPRLVKLTQVRYALPSMGQWLQINENLDYTSQMSGLGELSSIPTEAQGYTDLGNLDAAILEGMYRGLTLNTPLEGVGKYVVKIMKNVAKKKLEGADTSGAVLDALGKMVGAEILKSILPKNPIGNIAIDKVAGKLTKGITGPLNEKLFDDDEAAQLKQYFQDTCRFQIVRLNLYTNKAVNLGLVIVDTKTGAAHFVFVAPPRKLVTGGEYPGAILTGDITVPEEGASPGQTILNLTLNYVPQ